MVIQRGVGGIVKGHSRMRDKSGNMDIKIGGGRRWNEGGV